MDNGNATRDSSRKRTLRSSIGRYGIIPHSVFELLPGDLGALAVYSLLACYANKDGECWPSQATIAEALGVSVPTVKRALERLRTVGLLDVSRTVKGNQYVLVVPNAQRLTGDPTEPEARDHPRSHGGITGDPSSRAGDPLLEEQSPENSPADAARTIVQHVWERKRPKPAQPFVAVVKIAQRLLDAQHSPRAIEDAMIEVPTISTRWCEGVLNRKNGRKRDGPSVTQQWLADQQETRR